MGEKLGEIGIQEGEEGRKNWGSKLAPMGKD
jgi:hypothetical protein